MASRGSVIPLFVEQIRRGQPLTVTDPTHDALPDVARGIGRSGARSRSATATRRHLRAEGAGVDGGRPGAGVAQVLGSRPPDRGHRHAPRREAVRVAVRARRWRRGGPRTLLPDPGGLRDLNYDKFVEQGEPRSRNSTTTPRTIPTARRRADEGGAAQARASYEGCSRARCRTAKSDPRIVAANDAACAQEERDGVLKVMTIVGTRPEIIRLSRVIASSIATATSAGAHRPELRLRAQRSLLPDLDVGRPTSFSTPPATARPRPSATSSSRSIAFSRKAGPTPC